ncbi:hypothetical protein, partial [Lactiplantibacillus plantarum]
RVSGATDALFLFSIISKTGLEKSEDFSRPALFLETYVTASFLKIRISRSNSFCHISSIFNNKITANSWDVSFTANSHSHLSLFKKDV